MSLASDRIRRQRAIRKAQQQRKQAPTTFYGFSVKLEHRADTGHVFVFERPAAGGPCVIVASRVGVRIVARGYLRPMTNYVLALQLAETVSNQLQDKRRNSVEFPDGQRVELTHPETERQEVAL